MPELITAVGEALTGRGPDEGLSFGSLLGRLADVAGSGAAAARLIGVNPTTFYRWRRGTQRPKVGEGIIRRQLREKEVNPQLRADIKTRARTLKIVGTVTVSNDTRTQRKCDVGAHIPAPLMTRIVNTWISGADERANKMLWNAIDKYYVEGMEIESIDYCEFS